MKHLFTKTLFTASILLITKVLFAQNDAASFLKAGKEEANKIVNGYLQPISRGLSSGINDAWYSTAKPLGLLGFDIKVGFGGSLVNNDSKTFTLNSIGANTDSKSNFLLTPISGDINTKQPTIMGDGNSSRFAISTLNPLDNTQRLYIDTINSFSGTGSFASVGTTPFIQVSLGIIKSTEIMVRLMPIQSGDFTSNGFGFGVKHSLSQWIWGVEKLPIDIAAIATYNTNNLELAFGENFLNANSSLPGSLPSSDYKNSQKMTIKTSGYQAGVIVSKKLLFFTPYLGVTYHSATSDVAMKGIFPIKSLRNNNGNIEEYTENITDPISFSSKAAQAYKGTLGFRFKLGPAAFGAEYNHSFANEQFSTFNATFAINIQQLAPIPKL
jgi:hypothetical protein